MNSKPGGPWQAPINRAPSPRRCRCRGLVSLGALPERRGCYSVRRSAAVLWNEIGGVELLVEYPR